MDLLLDLLLLDLDLLLLRSCERTESSLLDLGLDLLRDFTDWDPPPLLLFELLVLLVPALLL